MKAIIVEGPDGAGKDTLIAKLQAEMGWDIAPRASHSTAGPLGGYALSDYVFRHTETMLTPAPRQYIYNRFPLISEPIYAAALKRPSRPYFDQLWWLNSHQSKVYAGAHVIFCLPPLEEVKKNVEANTDNQMGGVVEHIEEIYSRYWNTMARWMGSHCTYNYVVENGDATRVIQVAKRAVQ